MAAPVASHAAKVSLGKLIAQHWETYPILLAAGCAGVAASAYGIRCATGNPDVYMNRDNRRQLIRENESEGLTYKKHPVRARFDHWVPPYQKSLFPTSGSSNTAL